jgi:hypothetical protein
MGQFERFFHLSGCSFECSNDVVGLPLVDMWPLRAAGGLPGAPSDPGGRPAIEAADTAPKPGGKHAAPGYIPRCGAPGRMGGLPPSMPAIPPPRGGGGNIPGG